MYDAKSIHWNTALKAMKEKGLRETLLGSQYMVQNV